MTSSDDIAWDESVVICIIKAERLSSFQHNWKLLVNAMIILSSPVYIYNFIK